VEAPVTGSKNGAEKGTLLIMTGATSAALARRLSHAQAR